MLVTKESLEKYRVGSYEDKVAKITEAVRQWEDRAGVCTNLVVASFPEHAIVVSKEGVYSRLKIKEGLVVEATEFEGPKVYTDPKQFFSDKAALVVEKMLSGKNTADDVASLMMNSKYSDVDESIIEKLHEIGKDNTLWSRFYRERLVEVTNVTWSKAVLVEERNQKTGNAKEILARCIGVNQRLSTLYGVSYRDESIKPMLYSIQETCSEMQKWLSKLVPIVEELGDAAIGLVECLSRIDNLVTYAETMRIQEGLS